MWISSTLIALSSQFISSGFLEFNNIFNKKYISIDLFESNKFINLYSFVFAKIFRVFFLNCWKLSFAWIIFDKSTINLQSDLTTFVIILHVFVWTNQIISNNEVENWQIYKKVRKGYDFLKTILIFWFSSWFNMRLIGLNICFIFFYPDFRVIWLFESLEKGPIHIDFVHSNQKASGNSFRVDRINWIVKEFDVYPEKWVLVSSRVQQQNLS